MACSRCGSSAAPRGGRCVVCGAPLAAASATGPAGDLGTHTEGSADAGPPPLSSDEPTHPGESSLLGPEAPTGSSLNRTISESPASALATGTGEEATGPGYGAPVSADPDAPTGTGIGGAKTGPRRHGGGGGTGPLSPGQDFGARYHVIRLLGVGGHGRRLSGLGQDARGRGGDQGDSPAGRRRAPRKHRRPRSASSASCCSRARSPTATSSASTISARSTASPTSRCRTCRDRTCRRS